MAFRKTDESNIVKGIKVPAAVAAGVESQITKLKKGTKFRSTTYRDQIIPEIQKIRGAKAKAKTVAAGLVQRTLVKLRREGFIDTEEHRSMTWVRN